MLLNGIAISAVNPSSTSSAAVSNSTSQDVSPRGTPSRPRPKPRLFRIASPCTP